MNDHISWRGKKLLMLRVVASSTEGGRRQARIDICSRAGGHCEYCNKYVGMRGTLDHYLAQALGGQSDYENLRWACWSCNNRKGQMSPAEWAAVQPTVIVPPKETKAQVRVRLAALIARRQREAKPVSGGVLTKSEINIT